MPQWGLTEEMRRQAPWNLPDYWLAAGKVITDPVHGDIYLTKLEVAVVDSSPFQRLRRIAQLGTVPLVYPGATHSRFSHSLGALRVVQDLFDIVLTQRDAPYHAADLFEQWREDVAEDEYWRLIGEALVLGRLGALLHDIGHVPFGHTVEDDLRLLDPHDRNVERFEEYWRLLGDGLPAERRGDFRNAINGSGLREALRPLILSDESVLGDDKQPLSVEQRLRSAGQARGAASGYPFVADMVGNTICADLLDYLRRDHLYTGLPAALGHRFMTGFYVVPARRGAHADGEGIGVDRSNIHYPERMALHIDRDKRERKDIVSELLKHLRFRYELQERVYSHHAKTAADAMLGKLLGYWHDAEWIELAAQSGGDHVTHVAESDVADRASVKAALAADLGTRRAARAEQEIGDTVRSRLERRMRWSGDDALLDALASLVEAPAGGDAEEGRGRDGGDGRPPARDRDLSTVPAAAAAARGRCGRLARDLLSRRLYKRAAQAAGATAHEKLFELFSDPQRRKELEADAARYSEVDPAQVVIWLPEPRMRMKTAEVLVDYGSGIAPFNEHSALGGEIYAAHRALWAITVYIHVDVRLAGAEPWVMARLAQTMGIEWDRHRPPGAQSPTEWPLAQAARDPDLQATERELRKVLERVGSQVLYRAKAGTWRDAVAQLAHELGKLRSDGIDDSASGSR